MNKIDEVLKLKELLDSGLISQSDFDRLKNQIFEETNNEVSNTNQFKSSEAHQNTQERNNDSFDKRKCPQCGSENHVDNNDCIVCKTDLIKFRQPTEPYQEPDVENKQSNYLIPIFLIVLLIIFASFFIFKNHQTSPNAEAAQDTTHVEAPVNSQDIPQTDYVDTTNISNDTVYSSEINDDKYTIGQELNGGVVFQLNDEKTGGLIFYDSENSLSLNESKIWLNERNLRLPTIVELKAIVNTYNVTKKEYWFYSSEFAYNIEKNKLQKLAWTSQGDETIEDIIFVKIFDYRTEEVWLIGHGHPKSLNVIGIKEF